MGDYSSIGDEITKLFIFMIVALAIFVPLGMWKLVEIAVWIHNNVHLVIK